MNILQPKLNLLKDITLEYASSMKSVGNVRSQCEFFLNRLQFELTMRLNERSHFTTKAGTALRDSLLENYRGLISKIHFEYCRHQEIYLWMSEQYESLHMTINNTDFAIQELKKIRKWSIEESNYNKLAYSRSFAEELSFNKENIHIQPRSQEKAFFQGNQWKLDYNVNEKKYKKDWIKVKLSSQQRREELINMQKKLEEAQIAQINIIIDECLTSLTDFSFLKCSKKFKDIKLSESFSRQSIVQVQYNQSYGGSLGLESMNEEVNLLCNELIEDFNASRGSELQRITEREEQHLESESSPTPQKRLTESTD